MGSRAPGLMPLDPDTAPKDRSIWKDIDRDVLENQAQALYRKQHVAGRESYAQKTHSENDILYPLSFEAERNLADDFAFIAASQPKVEYVTAAVIEQDKKNPSFLIKLAANEGVSQDVKTTFDNLFEVLRQHARGETTRLSCQEEIFHLIVRLNCNRILGRLGSSWFQRPTYMMKTREPLPARLRDLFRNNVRNFLQRHRFHNYTILDNQITNFETAFKQLDEGGFDEIVGNVENAIMQAFHLTEDGVKLPDRLRALGCPVACLDTRDVREVGKVSNYWRIARQLAIYSYRFRDHFANADWVPLSNYSSSTTSKVQSQQFVHAEIQVLVHYELTVPEMTPRVIGVSKEACFLCDSFVRAHGRFSVTGAHRQIFPQWTIPDLEEFDSQTIQRFRHALFQVCIDVKTEYIRSQRRHPWRPYPLQSAINLNVILLGTPSTSTLLLDKHTKSSQGVKINEADVSYSASVPSVATPGMDLTDVNEGVNLQDANFESTSLANQPPHGHSTNALIEVPIKTIVDRTIADDIDWVHTFATFSTTPLHNIGGPHQRKFSQASILLEPVLADEKLRKVHLVEILDKELVLNKGSNDTANEISFVLVGSGGKELRFRCQWHV